MDERVEIQFAGRDAVGGRRRDELDEDRVRAVAVDRMIFQADERRSGLAM